MTPPPRRPVLLATLVAALALLCSPVPAHADDPDAARRGAAWLAERSGTTDDVGILVDIALAHTAAGEEVPADDLARIEAGLGAHVEADPMGAAHVAILADARGQDPRDVAGVDLVAEVREGIGPDGSFGAFPGPFASGLGTVALSRAGEEVPDALIEDLLAHAADDGGFGAEPGAAADADNTALAILALLTVESDAAAAARDAALGWAEANQREDGSWDGPVPVASTALMASAMASAGRDVGEAQAWLAAQQDGAGGFPSAGEGGEGLTAAAQAVLALAGVSYLDVEGPLPETGSEASGDEAEGAVPGSIPVPALAVAGAVALVAGGALVWRTRPRA